MNKPESNTLEAALEQAATDPASRPEFLRILLESEIFIFGSSDSSTEGHTTPKEGSRLSIISWVREDGTKYIPFFTSFDALQSTSEDEEKYLVLPARYFFELTKGSDVFLNPTLSYRKEFFSKEIEALLDTDMNQVSPNESEKPATQVLLAQPANLPLDHV